MQNESTTTPPTNSGREPGLSRRINGREPELSGLRARAVALQRPLILLADDDVQNVRLISFLLEVMYGFRVKGAHTARLALQLADELQPDLIITDIEKPDMNGLDMLARLKASSAVEHIPIVVHTGYGDSYRQRSMDVGAVAFISKPYDIDDLVTIIEDVLGVERTTEDWSLAHLNRLTTEQA